MKKVTSCKINLFFLLLTLLLLGCKDSKRTSKNSTTPSKNYSKFLSILETDQGIKISIKHPEKTNKTYNYFISKNSNNSTPFGFIKLDVQSMNFIVFSTTHIGMLAKLNQLHRIKGTCSKELIYNVHVREKILKGDIKDFGQESNPSLEKIISLNPKAIIFSGISTEFSKGKELEKLGIISIPNFDWKEAHPLGKAEWILLFGYLTGTEKEAKEHIKSIRADYENLHKLAFQTKVQPSVISGSKMGDFWYGPAGKSYGARLLIDANSNYIYKNTEGFGSIEYSLEKVFQDGKTAEFWINPGAPAINKLLLQNPKASYFNAFRNKKVYCYTNDPNKYWELSGVHPEWVLSDLIKIFHPEIDLKNPMYFYKKLE